MVTLMQLKMPFQPATWLINRLKYPQKFVLISAIFLLPLGLALFLLLSEIQSRIDFANKELQGIHYLRPLRQLQEPVFAYQRHNQTSDRPDLAGMQGEIASRLKELQGMDQQLGGRLKTTDLFATLQETWLLIRQQAVNRPTPSVLLTQLRSQLDDLRFQVGDQSNLILDPDLDTYYLMDATLLKLPAMQAQLAEIQQINQRVRSHQKLTPLERSQLIILSGTLTHLNRDLTNRMAVAFRNNPDGTLYPRLNQPLIQLSNDLRQLTTQLDGLVYPDRQFPPEEVLQQTEITLTQSFRLWDQSLRELDSLLQRRIDGFVYRQWSLSIFVLVILAIAAYVFVGFYQGVMQTIAQLSAASQRMVSGTQTEAVELSSRDEMAEVVRSFNTVADALREAEANYRSIFENSAEGIFQTTVEGHYQTANPMLARIYGYDSPEDLITHLTDIAGQLYVDPQRRSEFAQQMQASDKVLEFESEIYRRDRSTLWISESARSLYDAAGTLIGYEGTVVDISRRKQAEQEVTRLTQRLQDENLRMSAELQVTRRLQEMLMPTERELEAVAGLDIAGFMEPAAEVGGDYYDVMQHNGKVRISIGDVTGHGLESSMVMLMAQTAVRTLVENGETDPARLLNAVNRTIYENTRRMQSYKNMTLLLLEYEAGMLRLSGQHEELIIVRRDGAIEQIDTLELGFPLGLESDISQFVAETEITLLPGDVAVLYTDGITEAMNLEKEQYGIARMHEVLRENRDRPAQEIRQCLIADLMQYIQTQRVFDDITLVVLKQQ